MDKHDKYAINRPSVGTRLYFEKIDWSDFSTPPKELSLEDQALWWEEMHPEWIRAANHAGLIPPEVLEIILQSWDDKLLAQKINNRKKVPGLNKEERSRLYYLLTGGLPRGAFQPGRHSLFSRNLRIAAAIQGITNPRKRNQIIREMLGDSYSKIDNNTAKLLRAVNSAWNEFTDADRGMVLKILDQNPSEEYSSESLHAFVQISNKRIEI